MLLIRCVETFREEEDIMGHPQLPPFCALDFGYSFAFIRAISNRINLAQSGPRMYAIKYARV
jgi:hypothetical protein